jgi:hypothetical protein
MSNITIAPPTCVLVFDEPTSWTDRSLPTASWWDRYEIQPGAYAFEWVNINGRPWNADPEAKTSGYLANIGPYYAQVTVQAQLAETYRVNRLFHATSAEHENVLDAPITTLSRSVYAYQIPGCPKGERGRGLEHFLGGRVVDLREAGIDHDDEGRPWVQFAGPFETYKEALAFAAVAQP